MFKILLVEDEKRMQEIVADYFYIKGCKITCVDNGIDALNIIYEESFDLILLDIMIPKLDGFHVCREVRKNKDIPIIFITAKCDEEDSLYGYELGCDDYVTKPFSLAVLYAKVTSLIKRAKGIIIDEKLIADEIYVDCKNRIVTVNNQEVKLAPKEYDLLLYFINNKNRIITREQLLIKFWGYDFEGNERVVDSHIKKLRKALMDSAYHIHTIIKIGYKFEVNNEES